MKTIVTLICLLSATALQAQTTYNYKVQVLPPFGKVLINYTITCPNRTERNICQVKDLKPNTDLVITGIKNHRCDFRIHQDGSVELNQDNSYFCAGVTTVNATETKTGFITLPQHF